MELKNHQEQLTEEQFQVLDVRGMHCASCAARVEDALNKHPGVEAAQVNFATGQARVTSQKTSSELIQIVVDAGYDADIHENSDRHKEKYSDSNPPNKRQLLEVVVAFIGAVIIMGMSMFPVVSLWPRFTLPLLTLLVLMWPGRSVFLVTLRLARHGGVNMDTLIAVGSGAAFTYSMINLFRGSGGLFFDSSAMIVAIVLLGRYLEDNARSGAVHAIEHLMQLQNPTVRQLNGENEVEEIPISSLKVGDRFLVSSGEAVATDAFLTEGSGELNESMMTGESMPVVKVVGEELIGGSIHVGTERLVCRATAIGKDTILAAMVRMVEEAQSSKPKIQKLADRIARVFVPTVMTLSVLTWLLLHLGFDVSHEQALMRAIAVLIIACPCALGLATPLAIVALIGRAAQSGILVRDADVLESLTKIDHVLFDKTGTLTEGRPKVTASLGQPEDPAALKLWGTRILTIAQSSRHPLAEGVSRYLRSSGFSEHLEFDALTEKPGKGVEISLLIDGNSVKGRFGQTAWVTELSPKLELADQPDREGFSQVDVQFEDGYGARFWLQDSLRPTAKTSILRLMQLGVKPFIVSGDHESVVSHVSSEVGGTAFYAGCKPEDKINHVRRLQHDNGAVAMVGDGVNDAPALAQANVGIAVGRATDVAMATAQVLVPSGDLNRIGDVFALGSKGFVIMKQNLFWAFAYNVVAIPAAALGHLSPMIAAAAMMASSLTVVMNSMRLKRM